MRIVFRVKTNRGFDDENGGNPSAAYDSGTRGAAIVDNVVVNGWAAANGDFEAANSINNDTAVAADGGLEVDREAPGRVLPRALGAAGLGARRSTTRAARSTARAASATCTARC